MIFHFSNYKGFLLFFAKEEFLSSPLRLFISLSYVEDEACALVVIVLPLGIRNRLGYDHVVKNS